ncbi:hypothetical protein AGOR_G00046520 [Albula goreensis]|uniref:trypsin n=1 Tax=Albula goreensis TaxID=1534307 RepID=A0A8T3DXG1_9TELE|nr:hypothetical protein AGOR_G00046520 [Albula goreensis]
MANPRMWMLAVILINSIPGDTCVEIIGGREVKAHSKPFMALIRGDEGLCGGALIKQDWVLTAAHCKSNVMNVTLGAHSSSRPEKEQQQFAVARAIPHSKFNLKTGVSDLMLLKLNKPARLNQYVKILALPKPVKDEPKNTQCTIAGWGLTQPNGKQASDKLMAVNVKVVNRKECGKIYKKMKIKIKITSDMLCAWDDQGRKDTSNGDSGGPLVCGEKFVAVVSFGKKGAPGVYTLLSSKHVKWIHKIIGGNQ